jgi:hypothetical protein
MKGVTFLRSKGFTPGRGGKAVVSAVPDRMWFLLK